MGVKNVLRQVGKGGGGCWNLESDYTVCKTKKVAIILQILYNPIESYYLILSSYIACICINNK